MAQGMCDPKHWVKDVHSTVRIMQSIFVLTRCENLAIHYSATWFHSLVITDHVITISVSPGWVIRSGRVIRLSHILSVTPGWVIRIVYWLYKIKYCLNLHFTGHNVDYIERQESNPNYTHSNVNYTLRIGSMRCLMAEESDGEKMEEQVSLIDDRRGRTRSTQVLGRRSCSCWLKDRRERWE